MVRLNPRKAFAPDFSFGAINIVFLLLMYFIVSGTIVRKQEVGVELATTREIALSRLARPVLIVESDGTMEIEGRVVAAADVGETARSVLAGVQRPDASVSILAAADLPADTLVALAASLAAAGVPARLVTLREPEAEPAEP